jgi:tetratricopeptide (TPR) repeat protein
MQKWSEAKMWLRRCTELSHKELRLAWLPTVLFAVVLSGCASGGSTRKAADALPDDAGKLSDVRVVPPEAAAEYEQALAAMASGELLDAQIAFQDFLLRYPDYPGAHVNLAIVFAGNGDDDAAEASLNAALAIDPGFAPALNQVGLLRRRQGRFHEAEEAYLAAIAASPGYALPHYNLGVLNELYLQKLESALENFERYQALVEEDAQVGKWIADLQRRTGVDSRTANVTE